MVRPVHIGVAAAGLAVIAMAATLMAAPRTHPASRVPSRMGR